MVALVVEVSDLVTFVQYGWATHLGVPLLKPKIICHRGASLVAPENTFAAAQAALRLGGDIIELDVRESRDGVLYVLHDETVDRTTNGTGPIAEMTSAEVDALDAGAWFAPDFAGERVPRLAEYLAHFKDRAGFYVEVKWAECERIARVIDDLGVAAQCFTCSFDAGMRADMRKHAPDVRQMVHWKIAGNAEAARDIHHAQIVEFFEGNFDEAAVASAKALGLEVNLWTDHDNAPLFDRAIRAGLDGLNIDHIERVHAMRADYAARAAVA